MKTSNFTFLSKILILLSYLGRQAEENLYSDPNTSMFKVRQFVEKMVQIIMDFEHIPESDGQTLHTRLQVFRNDDIVPLQILSVFHSLKNIGKNAVHGLNNSIEDATWALIESYRLATWFMQTYGDWYFEPNAFLLPTPQWERTIDNHEYDERLSKLEREFEGLIGSRNSDTNGTVRRPEYDRISATSPNASHVDRGRAEKMERVRHSITWVNIDKPMKKFTIHSDRCVYVGKVAETPYKGINQLKRDGGWFEFDSRHSALERYQSQYSNSYKLIEHC